MSSRTFCCLHCPPPSSVRTPLTGAVYTSYFRAAPKTDPRTLVSFHYSTTRAMRPVPSIFFLPFPLSPRRHLISHGYIFDPRHLSNSRVNDGMEMMCGVAVHCNNTATRVPVIKSKSKRGELGWRRSRGEILFPDNSL